MSNLSDRDVNPLPQMVPDSKLQQLRIDYEHELYVFFLLEVAMY
jgi:hypothetical protein